MFSRKIPQFGTIANLILVGWYCDGIQRFSLVPQPDSLYLRCLLLAIGILLWGFGSGVYIRSALGAGPRDWLMLALHTKIKMKIRWVRTCIEVSEVGFGIALGGPFFIGTILFSLTIGHATEFGLFISKHWMETLIKGKQVSI